MYHEHPLRILRYSMKNIWLLIFPLLRSTSIIKFNPDVFYEWLRGAWKDVAVLGVIIMFGFVQWYFSRISITDKEVIHTNGIIIKITTSIPIENISTATSEQAFYLVPFRAMTFKCDTRAGIFDSTDMELLVNAKVGSELMSKLPKAKEKKQDLDFPKPTLLSVLLFSAFFSSGFSGAVYIATFFFKGGDIAHDILNVSLERLTETTTKIQEVAQKIAIGVPRAGIAIGIFFLSAWLLSFIVNIMRYSRFRVSADNKYINISCGITNRKNYRIRSDYINYTDLRQNLIMKLCGAVSVNISCAGYGSGSKQLPVLLPMRKENNLGSALESIGVSTENKNNFRPKISGLLSYTCMPILGIILVCMLYYLITRYMPQLSELAYFLMIMGEIPLVWLTAVKTAALFRSGISVDDEKIIVCTSKMTTFHTVIAETENVVIVEIKQTIFQRITKKKCHVTIWFTEEKKSRFTVKSLSVEDAEKICNLL